MWLYYLIPVAVAAVLAVAGVIRRDSARPDVPALVAVALAGVGSAVLAASTHEPDVPAGQAVFGVLGAGVFLGAAPACAYFALGRALARRPIALGLVFAASAVPLVVYLLMGWFVVIDVVHCPPDAYECPF